MSLDEHVNVTLTRDSTGITRAGFGTTLMLSATAAWSERTRTYEDEAGVLDDFPEGTPEQRAAAAIFAQNPRPETIKIGRCALKPTQQYTLSANAENSVDFDINVKGDDFDDATASVTSDSAATAAEIHSAMITALNAVTGNNYLAAFAALVIADDVFTAEADTEVLTDVAHGFQTGDGPVRVSNAGGALPAGLLEGVDYWIIKIDADNFYLASSLANAFAGTNVTITTDGTGVQTISDTASEVVDFTFTAEADDETFTAVAHGLHTGDKVRVSGGSLPTGVLAATDYWVIKLTADTFQLATSLANAQSSTELLITTDGSGTVLVQDVTATVRPSDPVTVTADAAGDWFSLELANVTRWNVAQTHANPGVATDLAAIADEDPNFYHVHTFYNSDAYVKAVAAWVESNKRIYTPALSESVAILVAADGTQGTLDDLDALNYARTATMWYHDPSAMADAAWAGSVLPIDPGGIIFAYRQLAGVTASTLSATHRTNLENRNATFMKSEAAKTFTWRGRSCAGEPLDIIRDLDWTVDDVQKEQFGILVGNNKLPYTDKGGASAIRAGLNATAKRIVDNGIASDDPAPAVFVPKVKNQSSANKANRIFPGAKLSFTLANAIEEIRVNIFVSQ